MRTVSLSVLLVSCLCASGLALERRDDARVYEGERLDAVAMPVGGIGTGTVWVAGDGRLAVWQIFNNQDERPLPDTFLAVAAGPPSETGGSGAEGATGTSGAETRSVRILQRAEGPAGEAWGAGGFPDVRCVGEYPFLRTAFRDPGFPVRVELETFNPFIPTSTKDSSLPCAIFRIRATNESSRRVDATLLFSLLNPIGYVGGELAGRSFGGFGGNRSRFEAFPATGAESPGAESSAGATTSAGGRILFDMADAKGPRVSKEMRLLVSGRSDRSILHAAGVRAASLGRGAPPSVDAVWAEALTGGERKELWAALGACARDGGVVLVSGAEPSFWEKVVALRRGEKTEYEHEVFEDFEGGAYDGWTVEGTAFGKAPHTGTTFGQQTVSGFAGKRLVNTFLPDDGPHGRLLSKPFEVRRRHIGFLVGGGSHAGRTCIDLLVDGKVVRTKTGRDNELLEPASWDVADLRGKTARIEIVDRESGGWGHINVDHIIFSDHPPELILAPGQGLEDLVALVPVRLVGAASVSVGTEIESPFPGVSDRWKVGDAVAVSAEDAWAYEVVAERAGVPLVVTGPFGKGKIVLALAKGLPASWGMTLLARALGATYEHGEGIDRGSPLWGSLALSAVGAAPTAAARWTDAAGLWKDLRRDGRLDGPADSGPSPPGETHAAALAATVSLEPGETKGTTFILSWHFPNVDRFGHRGNRYADWFGDAAEVDRYVRANLGRLAADTELFHDTVYATNLPYLAVDAFTSQLAILRGPTCWWAQKHKETGEDYFAGFEGAYGCCPLNCTHVWNYAQSHARLFPEIGRNLRKYDFLHYLRPDGETQHRQHSPHGAFIDGHCAVIEGAYREHLTSADDSFLKEVYPEVKKAVEWLIRKIDPDEDGVNGGQQWNTYDVPTDGAHTFIGSQYLSALEAASRMALLVGDDEAARRWRKIRESGSVNQDAKLWAGEYWIQIPEPKPARDYNGGCHSDQLLGQWWAHMLDLGYLYPADRVKTALRSIFRYNFRRDFRGFRQSPRRYVLDDEAGLLMCTWPGGDRPDPFILYADEVWTGIEYEVAGLMIYEGLIEEGLAIVKAARDRYDGRVREGLNSGPGGNPFNELECGKFYARALSSWSILLAAQGAVYDGPRGVLGFRPRWRPEDHASFFSAARGWGLFTQKRDGARQASTVECRWGTIDVAEVMLAAPAGWRSARATLRGSALETVVGRSEGEVRLTFPRRTLSAGDRLVVELSQ